MKIKHLSLLRYGHTEVVEQFNLKTHLYTVSNTYFFEAWFDFQRRFPIDFYLLRSVDTGPV